MMFNPPSSSQNHNTTDYRINNLKTTGINSIYIKCKIEGEPVILLVDTGADVSVLSKELVDKFMLINNQIPYLPVNGVHISNAVGKNICRVSRQLFCNCEINNIQFKHNFIQVDKLKENGIIGADILTTYRAKINFEEKTIKMIIQGQNHFLPFFEKTPTMKTDILQIQQLIHNKTMELDSGDLNPNPNHNFIKLTEQENNLFQQILSEYDEKFREKPGRIQDIECQIRITKREPIFQGAYPIPMSKLSKMEQEIQRLLELKIIEPSSSPWSLLFLLLFLLKRKKGTKRNNARIHVS